MKNSWFISGLFLSEKLYQRNVLVAHSQFTDILFLKTIAISVEYSKFNEHFLEI